MAFVITTVVVAALFAASILVAPKFTVHQEGLVLISGASTGIGRHAAEQLASSGYTVYAGVRKQSDFDSIVALENPRLLPLKLDVTDHDSVVAAVNTITESMTRRALPLVAVVNNAGISRRIVGEFHSISDAKWVFETNFFGMMDLTQMTLPLLRMSQGRVIMISSLLGRIGNPTSGVYAASKFAMEGFSDSLRREVKRFGIPVSLIEPAMVATEIHKKLPDNSLKNVDEEAKRLYPDYYDEKAAAKMVKQAQLASPATVTSDAIQHAISSPKPNTRYVVANVGGTPAWILAFLTQYLPDHLVDYLFNSLA